MTNLIMWRTLPIISKQSRLYYIMIVLHLTGLDWPKVQMMHFFP